MLTLMEELKTNQREQTERHEQQQTELLGELRTSPQQQSEQLAKLAEEYGRRMDSLIEDQTRIEESVSTLESNIDSVKSVLQNRIGETEGKIELLQSQQIVLANKQEELKTNFQQEIL